MIDLLKSIGGFLLVIALIIGSVFLVIFFIKGGIWLSVKVLPWLSIALWVVLALDILLILPLGIFDKTKAISAVGFISSSYVYGLTLWFWALLITYILWGGIAVFIGLIIAGVGVVPMAVIATMLTGDWASVLQLVLLLLLTYGSRLLGYYLAQRVDELTYQSDYGFDS